MEAELTQATEMRKERIERLLRELEYEITRGVMEREIEPDLHMVKMMPFGQNQAARLDFHLSPSNSWDVRHEEPRLKLVT